MISETHLNFPSQYVLARRIDVWLPPAYTTHPTARFPVLYMPDGQNLFEPALSAYGMVWGIDSAISRLVSAGEIEPAIVVGIWNSETTRRAEYMPQKAYELLADTAKVEWDGAYGRSFADNALRFLVEEVKPFIDKGYRTRPERSATTIMGSSMGGLFSLYALCEYPQLFQGVGCLSTHWPAGDGIMLTYLKEHLPAAGRHRLYFDYGTETLDSAYEPYQQKADKLLVEAGYQAGKDWLTRKFVGADHSERAWQARVHIPLRFLLINVRDPKGFLET